MNEKKNNSVVIPGISQNERLDNNLDPKRLKIDERKLHEILGSTHAFGTFLQYYFEQNKTNGDWTCFWEADPLAFLAIVGSLDTDSIHKNYWTLHRTFLSIPDDEKDENADIFHANELITHIRNLARILEDFYRLLPSELSLKEEILSFIAKDNITDTEQLAGALHTLIGFHKEVYPQTLEEPKDLNHGLYASFLGTHWEIPNAQAFYKIPFRTGYRENGFENLHDLFNDFLKAIKKVKNRALYWFNDDLENPEVTEPHIALFLAFLRLFDYAREGLNQLTEKHLEYYYKRILHVQARPAIPDTVYLVFELANHISEYKITQNHALQGGKDSNKNPILYNPVENWVIGKAVVEDVKNTFIGSPFNKILANPDITKVYSGQSEQPNEKAISYRGFGDDAHLPYGDLGFAIASPQLLLKEGERSIELDFGTTNNTALNFLLDNPEKYQLYLTTKDGWLLTDRKYITYDPANNVFSIELPADYESIETPEEQVLNTKWPALKITLNQKHESAHIIFERLTTIKLTHIDIRVEVTGIRENLVIHSDVGVFEGSQEFLPFGAMPQKGKLFRIGNAEALSKKIDALALQFDWIDPIDFNGYNNNYVDKNGSTIPFPTPQLKIDFQKGTYFTPHSGGNTNLTNIINDTSIFVKGEHYSQVKGHITLMDGSSPEGIRVYTILEPEYYVYSAAISLPTPDAIVDANGDFSIEYDENTFVIGLAFFPSLKHPENYKFLISDIRHTKTGINPDILINFELEFTFFYESDLITNNQLNSDFYFREIGLPRYDNALNFDRYTADLPQGFINVELVNGDFLHAHYATALTIQSIALSKIESTDKSTVIAAAGLPVVPFTPKTNGIKLNYRSSQRIEIGALNDNIDQYFHILPFNGNNEINLKNNIQQDIPAIYGYRAPLSKEKTAKGNLYIGLKDLKPGGSLSLLVHLQRGSEEEPDLQAPDIEWSYLAIDNTWEPFAAHQFLKDTTMGLTRTGIVQLLIPYNVINNSTLFQDNLYWLRVASLEDETTIPPKSILALPDIVDIKAQAIEASFTDNNNTFEHLANPLPAETISKLEVSRSEIKKIEQPVPSANGRVPEKGNEFYRRVSERLRHKDRAVTAWDYERIILEKYPEVKRAICIRHSQPGNSLSPGRVMVAVIPDISIWTGTIPADPRFPEGELRAIEQYMRTKTNLFVACTETDNSGNTVNQYLYIENPVYDIIRFSVRVKFKSGLDIEYHRFELDAALTNFLSPWLNDSSFELSFSLPIYRSKIIHFIEELSYIDKLVYLDIYQNDALLDQLAEQITPVSVRSIFTSSINESNDPNATNHSIGFVETTADVTCV